MRCTKCGTESTTTRKFCAACGNPLSLRCPRCGAENAPSSAFCEDCGAALAGPAPSAASGSSPESKTRDTGVASPTPGSSPAIESERKTITVLFADIKGSMSQIEDLDPEAASAIVDPALAIMAEAVNHYQGHVAQSTGDGVFALFGAPLAHEDHPQRAIYAAERMQDELRRYSERLRAEGKAPVEIRVGINTGEVVMRSVGRDDSHAEYLPAGHAVGLASRLQALAPTGSIALSEHTRRLVEGYFQLRPLGPTRIKGVTEAVNVYEVLGLGPLRTRLQRSASRGLVKFVGRQREMDTLKYAAAQARIGHGQIVAAVGEPGVGKSRLFFEFKASEEGWTVLETFASPHGRASAYLPVIDLLRAYFDIAPNDDERNRRQKVAARVAILGGDLEDALPYLFSLLGIVEGADPLAQMNGQIRKRRTLEAIRRILLNESLKRPLMLIFEDLHLIDEQTQELLNLLADSIGTAKILLLVNYRPEYSHQWNSKTYYARLRLDPLAEESTAEMLSALLGDGLDLIPLKRLIMERAEGTPFFIEEIVQALFEDGVLQRNGAVRLVKPMTAVKVSATVQAILASRIDRLPPAQKELLQTLAVIGREFPLSLVRRMVESTRERGLEAMLGDLQMAEFIYEQPAADDVGYVFKHALTQEVAYNSLLIERRKLMHEHVGRALESMFAGQLEDHLDELAHQYSRSNNASKAVEYLGRAGQQALQRSAYADAINRLTVAIELLRKVPDSPERLQRELLLQLALGPALMALKGYAAAEIEEAYTRALYLCQQLEDDPKRFSVLYGLWAFYLVREELEQSRDIGRQLLDMAGAAHDAVLLIEAHWALGCSLFWMGELTSACEELTRSLELYEPQIHHALTFRYGQDPGVSCLCYLAFILWQRGYPDQALAHGDRAVARVRQIGHPYDEAFALGLTAMLHQLRGEVEVTYQRAQRARMLSAEQGFPFWEAVGQMMQGWARRGSPEEGLAMATEGLRMYNALGSEVGSTWLLALMSEIAGKAGRHDLGLDTINKALAAVARTGERCYEGELYRLRGELTLAWSPGPDPQFGAQEDQAPKDPDARPPASGFQNKAEADFLRALELARRQQAKSWELRAVMSLTRLWQRQGRSAEAQELLSAAYNWFSEGFETRDLQEAMTLLESLRP